MKIRVDRGWHVEFLVKHGSDLVTLSCPKRIDLLTFLVSPFIRELCIGCVRQTRHDWKEGRFPHFWLTLLAKVHNDSPSTFGSFGQVVPSAGGVSSRASNN